MHCMLAQALNLLCLVCVQVPITIHHRWSTPAAQRYLHSSIWSLRNPLPTLLLLWKHSVFQESMASSCSFAKWMGILINTSRCYQEADKARVTAEDRSCCTGKLRTFFPLSAVEQDVKQPPRSSHREQATKMIYKNFEENIT